jgi:crossover junction endodeoxyribonuclease RusA
MVVSEEGRAFKRAVKAAAQSVFCPCYEGPIKVQYVLHPRANKDGSASKTRIDLGNCEKIASDALNGLAWNDDKQIVDLHMTLGEPRLDGALTIMVEEWEGK